MVFFEEVEALFNEQTISDDIKTKLNGNIYFFGDNCSKCDVYWVETFHLISGENDVNVVLDWYNTFGNDVLSKEVAMMYNKHNRRNPVCVKEKYNNIFNLTQRLKTDNVQFSNKIYEIVSVFQYARNIDDIMKTAVEYAVHVDDKMYVITIDDLIHAYNKLK